MYSLYNSQLFFSNRVAYKLTQRHWDFTVCISSPFRVCTLQTDGSCVQNCILSRYYIWLETTQQPLSMFYIILIYVVLIKFEHTIFVMWSLSSDLPVYYEFSHTITLLAKVYGFSHIIQQFSIPHFIYIFYHFRCLFYCPSALRSGLQKIFQHSLINNICYFYEKFT